MKSSLHYVWTDYNNSVIASSHAGACLLRAVVPTEGIRYNAVTGQTLSRERRNKVVPRFQSDASSADA
jgi:hypothetical protein